MRGLFCSAGVLAVLLSGGVAGAVDLGSAGPTSAVGGAYGGWMSAGLDNPGNGLTSAESWIVGLDGFVNHWLDGNLALQGDANIQFSGPFEFEPDVETSAMWLNGALHVAYREPERFAVAAFGALQSVSRAVGDDDPTVIGYGVVGLEAQAYADDLTLYGQAGMAFGPGGEEGGSSYRTYGDFSFLRGVVRYFPEDNLRLSAEALIGQGEIGYYSFGVPDYLGTTVPTTIAAVKLSADYRPDDSQASYFTAYEASGNWQSISGVDRSSLDQRVMVGVRFDIGKDSLKARDRTGVTWDVPQIAGLVGQANQLEYCFDPDCWPNYTPLP